MRDTRAILSRRLADSRGQASTLCQATFTNMVSLPSLPSLLSLPSLPSLLPQ